MKIKRKYRYKEPEKDRAWSALSDYVRIRDWYKYGTCVSCGKRIERWQDGQAGHFITMGGHGALIGFDDMNVHLQCAHCNSFGGMEAGAYYGEELDRRYPGLRSELEHEKHQTVKADKIFFINKQQEILEKMQVLAEKPDYAQ